MTSWHTITSSTSCDAIRPDGVHEIKLNEETNKQKMPYKRLSGDNKEDLVSEKLR